MKVIGIGLNKTGTKTLGRYLKALGLRHKTFDFEAFQLYRAGDIEALLALMEDYDSFEDWPWPLFYQDIDRRFPDARFVLTVRKNPETWYRSLCHMAVRMGPLVDYEKHVYGHAMPQGHRDEHIQFYLRHNREVEAYFRARPEKLLRLCWEEGDTGAELASFLGFDAAPELPTAHVNRSVRWVYTGDNRWLAHANRWAFQSGWVYEGAQRATSIVRSAMRAVGLR